MRLVLAMGLSLALASTALAAPGDDFARSLKGPWGQVSLNWQPLAGALAKNSCPSGGVKRKESIGLFGEGGAMWIEPAFAGAINIYEGSLAPRLLAFTRMDGTAAVYRESGIERRFNLEGLDHLTIDRVPAVVGVPSTNYERCDIKK